MLGAMNKLFKSIEALMAVMLASMITLVFINVILRYFFNSGITWSEEIARYLFVWLTFVGAIGAMRDNTHLGMDTVIRKLSPKIQKVVYIFGQILILVVILMVAEGNYIMVAINLNARTSATNLPLSFVYSIVIVTSLCISINVLANIYKAISNEGAVEKLIQLHESEEEIPYGSDGEAAGEENDEKRGEKRGEKQCH